MSKKFRLQMPVKLSSVLVLCTILRLYCITYTLYKVLKFSDLIPSWKSQVIMLWFFKQLQQQNVWPTLIDKIN